MTDVLLLDGLRTPFGKYLKGLRAVETRALGAHVLREILRRHPELAAVDGVILAQVLQGGVGQNPARQIAHDAGVETTVPAITLNNVCLGGMAAVADASRRIRLGEGSAYIVGGADSMSRARHAALTRQSRLGDVELTDTLVSDGLWCALDDASMGVLSEHVNVDLEIGREVQDEIALRSHVTAREATDRGDLAEEIVPFSGGDVAVEIDEGIRREASAEGLAKLSPAFTSEGTITAGNASQMTDGASLGAVASAEFAERSGQEPLGVIRGCAEVAGPDTSLHLRPAEAVHRVLDQARIDLTDVALLEITRSCCAVA